MLYGHSNDNAQDWFRSWVHGQSELLFILVQEGYSEDQAIEMLKVWAITNVVGKLERL